MASYIHSISKNCPSWIDILIMINQLLVEKLLKWKYDENECYQ